jgi:hypothetical protein
MILMDQTEELRKTCPSATLSTTNITSTDVHVNTGLSSKRIANNHLSHGMASSFPLHSSN